MPLNPKVEKKKAIINDKTTKKNIKKNCKIWMLAFSDIGNITFGLRDFVLPLM